MRKFCTFTVICRRIIQDDRRLTSQLEVAGETIMMSVLRSQQSLL